MSLKNWGTGALAWLEHAAAALFVAGLAIAALLHFTGRLSRERAADIYGLLRGEKQVVLMRDYERWQDMEKEAADRTAVETEERRSSGRAREDFEKHRKRFQKEFEKERRILQLLNQEIRNRQQRFDAERKKLLADRKKFTDEKDAEEKKRKDANLKKALKIYQGMDTEFVAEDFKAKWAGTQEEKDEVVLLLRNMSERLASEVINSIEGSQVRVDIMKAVKKP